MPLCRICAVKLFAVSNSYALESTFAPGEWKTDKVTMTVIAADQIDEANHAASMQGGFWCRLSQTLDAYFADRIESRVQILA